MSQGYLVPILHAHLPFVRHPEYPEFLEEDWLFEAITETYLPLLTMMQRLWDDGVDFRLAMTMSPPLIHMLDDELLRERYVQHLERLRTLAAEERRRYGGRKGELARYYAHLFDERLHQFEDVYARDLVSAFGRFQELGRLEILTCGATHGFLPLMADVSEAVDAQVRVAAEHYRARFGRDARGIWLPECAYHPGVEQVLARHGIGYFIGERHAIEHATPRPVHGVYAPIRLPNGVAVFGRDPETSAQVWSAESGYPGHGDYREFHRDLGWDAPFEHVAAYVQPNGSRKNVGIKYHRVTGKTDRKEYYDPATAAERAAEHAGNFVFNREHQVRWLARELGRKPMITAPYDAELFGHWWYEGPLFLEMMFRKLGCDSDVIETITPSEYLAQHPVQQVAQPHFSSWGANGYAEVWLEPENEWIYSHLLPMARRMVRLANGFPGAGGRVRDALNQAARELLLAQSSDWAFILHTRTSTGYARQRTQDHIRRFAALADMIEAGRIDDALLGGIEARDTIFADIDYRVYASQGTPTARLAGRPRARV